MLDGARSSQVDLDNVEVEVVGLCDRLDGDGAGVVTLKKNHDISFLAAGARDRGKKGELTLTVKRVPKAISKEIAQLFKRTRFDGGKLCLQGREAKEGKEARLNSSHFEIFALRPKAFLPRLVASTATWLIPLTWKPVTLVARCGWCGWCYCLARPACQSPSCILSPRDD